MFNACITTLKNREAFINRAASAAAEEIKDLKERIQARERELAGMKQESAQITAAIHLMCAATAASAHVAQGVAASATPAQN